MVCGLQGVRKVFTNELLLNIKIISLGFGIGVAAARVEMALSKFVSSF